jgi:hypothetical protein
MLHTLLRPLVRIYDLLGVPGRIGVLLVLAAWLVVSFSTPGNRRAVVEWLGACGLYLALVSLFTNLSLLAREAGSTVALVGFCFLLALFGSGLVVSLVQALLAIRGPSGRASADATH